VIKPDSSVNFLLGHVVFKNVENCGSQHLLCKTVEYVQAFA